ncbi:glycoside hydrolase family 95 protein [Paenibacillus nanensis]|uniref:Glycoside hydrolase family 95 protein n=1 Tax=Paenibacillus nanensis TaxID=393251 RepID=A0A3A1VEQ5_9BACL|nr:glycoside hydrolase family 95 protein [Paenibacillus nanensis]RIX59399.1 glycoside hydrolase family 95 protein [Paenibacillus nanensis]
MGAMKLSYTSPAAGWAQGLPIGNGRLGAVIQGGIQSETWSLTEITYWSGKPEEPKGDPAASRLALERMRERFFAEDYEAGERLARETLEPEKGNFGTHLTLCDLVLRFHYKGQEESIGPIKRELDLEEAVVSHAYECAGVRYERNAFATHAADIMVSRLAADQPSALSFTLELVGRTSSFETELTKEGAIRFIGRAVETIHSDGSCGVHARGLVKVELQGGEIGIDGDKLLIIGADEAILYIGVTTDYRKESGSWERQCDEQVEQAIGKGFDRLKSEHVADYRKLYERVQLDVGDSGHSALPLDERIHLLRKGIGKDPQLYALFYQYGRYLTIAGSREDSPLPMNLQGLWNDGEANRMAWSCDYHLDVNTEMNYYPTEAANLAECHVPLMRFVQRLSEYGRAAAKAFYGCDGWVAHVFTNAWGFASPGWGLNWGMNVTGGLWIAAQLKQHYEYSLDRRFLEETAYPVLKDAALFFLDYMTIHPTYGWLVSGPSNSPENSFYPSGGAEGGEYALSMGATMDQMLVRELFHFCMDASTTLGVDTELRDRLANALSLLPPLKIGAGGQLQEWLEDYGEAQPEHRHMSHLYGLYPGDQITPLRTPELSEAARITLLNRMAREGLEDVEFTLAQFAASFARLKDGENAFKQLNYLIGQLCFDNLLTYSKPGIAGAETNIFVADGNFGGTAAIGEMLMQSHAGFIELLPALPAAWNGGRVSGLRAKGGAEVDIAWQEGRLTEAAIRPKHAGRVAVRYGGKTVSFELEAARVYRLDGRLDLVSE